MNNRTIIHATSVHPWNDNRIFEKMVRGLSGKGENVYYIARESSIINEKAYPDIKFKKLKSGGKLRRLLNNFHIFRISLGIKRGIFHFHDPELIFVGLLLRLFGWKIVYDVHEDYKLAFRQKGYLHPYLRPVASSVINMIESISQHFFCIVLAEKAYKYRFKKGVYVLNYPSSYRDVILNKRTNLSRLKLIYTGTVSVDRGAERFADILRAIPSSEIYVVGRCANTLHQKIVNSSQDVCDRMHLQVSEQGVPFSVIEEYYEKGDWAYGIALFPYTQHYYEKELTKFFEYMSHGIPILCSSFPVWKTLIEGNDVGLCIDCENMAEDIRNHESEILSYEKWEHMSLNSVESASKYTWESQLDNLIALYNRLYPRHAA